jgi:hypothetical protein
MDLMTQLYKVIDLANRNGYPDAADFIRDRIPSPKVDDDDHAEETTTVTCGSCGHKKKVQRVKAL